MQLSVRYCPNSIFEDDRELYQFLLSCQQKCQEKGDEIIVSVCQKIEAIDLLAVIDAIAPSEQLHFYWENPRNKEGIVGFGSSKSHTIESSDRFFRSQKFIQQSLKQIIRTGDLEIPGAVPHFFCSFTFFDTLHHRDAAFAPATIFLPKFQIIRKNNQWALVANICLDRDTNIPLFLANLKEQLKKLDLARSNPIYQNLQPRDHFIHKPQNYIASNFKKSVAAALKLIDNHQFSKIVLADALDIVASVPFQLVDSLNNLRSCYPDCYIFSTSNGKGAYFIGASPERLISINNHELFTDALAGTAPRGITKNEDEILGNQLLQSPKERREHQAVTEFIIQRLHQLGLHPQKAPLQLLQLSNLQHLWTPIYAQLPAYLHPLDIVAQLHPTPAVAGVPTQIVCEQIRHYETFDRSLYAAPLGWIDYHGNSEFIVGIRSALIIGNQARLYAGAGIVEGSDPNKEVAEVQLKFQAILKALV